MPQLLKCPDHPDKDSEYVRNFYYELQRKGDCVPQHPHPFGHWSMVVLGVVEYTIGGKVTVLTAPDQIWIPKEVSHGMVSQTEKAICVCLIPKEAV